MSGLTHGLFSGGPIPALEKVVRFSEARHRLILGNIANAETPGYRRQDLPTAEFDATLERAIEDHRHRPAAGFRLDLEPLLRPVSTRPSSGLATGMRETGNGGVLRHDGNNVDIEREMAVLLRNSGRLRQGATLLKKYLDQIRAAVSGTNR